MKTTIRSINAIEILDSRGNPTVRVFIELNNGARVSASVPSGASTGENEAVELRDGESFAIAGLLRKDFQTTVRQVPLLGSIPILGALFRSSGFQKGETELLIVVTPHLVAPLKPEQVRLPTDRIKDPQPQDVLLGGEGYHPQALPPVKSADKAPQAKEKGYEF